MCNGKAYDTHDGKPLLSQVGPRQGDPLGSDLFCMGTHNNLRVMRSKYPQFMIDAYIDNVYIAVPADRAVRCPVTSLRNETRTLPVTTH